MIVFWLKAKHDLAWGNAPGCRVDTKPWLKAKLNVSWGIAPGGTILGSSSGPDIKAKAKLN